MDPEIRRALSTFRIGSVPYLNAAPLTFGMEDIISFAPPSQLSRSLMRGDLDVALLSVTEAMHSPGFVLLDGYGICSDGPVLSVFLAHQDPLEEIDEIYLDPASCTSVRLLQVLMADLGLNPSYKPLPVPYEEAGHLRNVLLIGNPAIRFLQSGTTHKILDLGGLWQEVTNLPFVYAAWIANENVDTQWLNKLLIKVAEFGLRHLNYIHKYHSDFSESFRRRYLGQAIRYPIGSRETTGLQQFYKKISELQGVSQTYSMTDWARQKNSINT